MNLCVCIPVQMRSGVHTGVSVDLNAQTGGTVNAPVLTGNTITGPVTIIGTTAGHGTSMMHHYRYFPKPPHSSYIFPPQGENVIITKMIVFFKLIFQQLLLVSFHFSFSFILIFFFKFMKMFFEQSISF